MPLRTKLLQTDALLPEAYLEIAGAGLCLAENTFEFFEVTSPFLLGGGG